jgi:hypothetical protein
LLLLLLLLLVLVLLLLLVLMILLILPIGIGANYVASSSARGFFPFPFPVVIVAVVPLSIGNCPTWSFINVAPGFIASHHHYPGSQNGWKATIRFRQSSRAVNRCSSGTAK